MMERLEEMTNTIPGKDQSYQYMGKVLKKGLSKFFKGFLPQNFLSLLLNTLSHIK